MTANRASSFAIASKKHSRTMEAAGIRTAAETGKRSAAGAGVNTAAMEEASIGMIAAAAAGAMHATVTAVRIKEAVVGVTGT